MYRYASYVIRYNSCVTFGKLSLQPQFLHVLHLQNGEDNSALQSFKDEIR